jgi:hypothetical protein
MRQEASYAKAKMRRERRELEWQDQGGVWLARASRNVGGRYGVAYDVHRLVRTGPDIWRLSYVGSGISLERALCPQL